MINNQLTGRSTMRITSPEQVAIFKTPSPDEFKRRPIDANLQDKLNREYRERNIGTSFSARAARPGAKMRGTRKNTSTSPFTRSDANFSIMGLRGPRVTQYVKNVK
jgi:hypothetical protein